MEETTTKKTSTEHGAFPTLGMFHRWAFAPAAKFKITAIYIPLSAQYMLWISPKKQAFVGLNLADRLFVFLCGTSAHTLVAYERYSFTSRKCSTKQTASCFSASKVRNGIQKRRTKL
jgi:hypothetical protein